MEAMEDHGGTSSVIGMSIKIEIPDETLSLWKEVASGLETNQTGMSKLERRLNAFDAVAVAVSSQRKEVFLPSA